VLADRKALESVLQASWFGTPLSSAQKAAARNVDPTPALEMGEEKVAEEIVTFTQWGGFFRERHEVNREHPPSPFVSSKEVLVKYSCGIIF
jgi:hypothetical protein